MKIYSLKNPAFKTTATNPENYPTLRAASGDIMPEIAVAGRSNVGKSTLLNHLLHSPGLVKTSATPGKTQALNFFTVNEELAFVDLPGYGYAKVPVEVRKKWGPMVQAYLQKRSMLKLVLFLFDIRRLPNDEDREFIEWISHYDKSMILVLTKVDKVGKNERSAQTKKILDHFGAANIHWIHYSSTKNIGGKELLWAINDALNEDSLTEEANKHIDIGGAPYNE